MQVRDIGEQHPRLARTAGAATRVPASVRQPQTEATRRFPINILFNIGFGTDDSEPERIASLRQQVHEFMREMGFQPRT